MIKRVFSTVVFVLLALSASAGRTVGFGADSFNRVVPNNYAKNAVFSPLSFEFDAVLFADASDPITRANVAETLGVLAELDGVYVPLYEERQFVSAKAFCVPEPKKVSPVFRKTLQDNYDASVLQLFPKLGAEAWLKAATEGEMENFHIPDKVAVKDRFAFFDLVSLRFDFEEPFPTDNTREMVFTTDSGEKKRLPMMVDARVVDTWETSRFSAMRLPMKGGNMFYAIKPKGDATLADVRRAVSSERIDILLTIMGSVSEAGVSHSPAAIALPKMDIVSSFELSPSLRYFRFPSTKLEALGGNLPASSIRQYARFRLDENGASEPLEKKAPENEIRIDKNSKRLFFNSPFVFFIYNQETASLLVAGQFTGQE